MTEKQIREKALEYVMRTDDKNDTIGDRMNRIEDFVAGAHTMFPEINDLKGQVASLEHLRETLVDQQAGLKTKLEIQQGLLDNAVSMLKDIYEDDDYFCTMLLDIDEEAKICEKCCDNLNEKCILRYLKHYKNEQ